MITYIIKILFGESVDFTAQYPYEHRSFHLCTILGYIYYNDGVHNKITVQ